MKSIFGIVLLTFLSISTANAALITGTVTATGSAQAQTTSIDLSLLVDGVLPADGSAWNAATNIFWERAYGASNSLVIDFGGLFRLTDALASVDNNDSYAIEISLDGNNWVSLFSIASSAGDVTWGMETFHTHFSVFTPVQTG